MAKQFRALSPSRQTWKPKISHTSMYLPLSWAYLWLLKNFDVSIKDMIDSLTPVGFSPFGNIVSIATTRSRNVRSSFLSYVSWRAWTRRATQLFVWPSCLPSLSHFISSHPVPLPLPYTPVPPGILKSIMIWAF